MRRLLVVALVALGSAVVAVPAQAAPFTLGPTSTASGLSPWAPGCGGPGQASAGSVLYQNAEVETHVAVNPTNANNVVAFWQQDRWSDGGAHGNLAGYSLNGGQTWAFSAPALLSMRRRRRRYRRLRARHGSMAVLGADRPPARNHHRV